MRRWRMTFQRWPGLREYLEKIWYCLTFPPLLLHAETILLPGIGGDAPWPRRLITIPRCGVAQ